MSYSSRADMDKRISQAELIRLTDEDDLGVVDEGKIEAAIEAADAEIDKYLERYLPLGVVPDVLKSWSTDIAIYNLYALDEGGTIPDTRQQRYDNATDALSEIESGEQSLPVQASSSNSTIDINVSGSERIFSRDKLKGW